MILLTGGSGLLGQELQKHIDCWAPSRSIFDITRLEESDDYFKVAQYANLIIHAAAFTDLVRAEKENGLCYNTNVIGTRNLATLRIPMIYISTEYVFDGEKGNYAENDYPNPQNFYSFTKLLGEYESRRSPRSVVIRCSFKPRPFEHVYGCVDMFTSGDYVNRIAKEIALAVQKFNVLPPTLHIGTGRKRIIDLAKETRPEIKPIERSQIGVKLPYDTSLDTTLWEKIKKEI